MSSEEDDEFFDAPEAFGINKNQWSDSEEDSSVRVSRECKNKLRRDKVESLKRNLDDSATPPSTLPSRINASLSREGGHLPDPNKQYGLHYATESRTGGDSGNISDKLSPSTGMNLMNKQSGAAVSAPECRLPNYENVDYVKSWSLDTARIHHQINELDSSQLQHQGQTTSVGPQSNARRNVVSNLLHRVSSVSKNRNSKKLNNAEILSNTPVTNLDTGERSALSQIQQAGIAENRSATLPLAASGNTSPPRRQRIGTIDANSATLATLQGTLGHDSTLNPIEMQYRERTKSFDQLKDKHNSSLQRSDDSDRDPDASMRSFDINGKMRKMQKNFKGALSAMKSMTKSKIFSQDTESSDEDEELVGNRGIRLRSSRRMKGRRDFLQIKLVQEMKNEHTGAIWAMRFSPCGRLLATAGYDRNIRIWVLRQYYRYFKQMQKSAGQRGESTTCNAGLIPSMGQVEDEDWLFDSASVVSTSASTCKTDEGSTCSSGEEDLEHSRKTPFRSRPLLVYRGHEGVVTDLTWSKNLFLLATSMDRQVRLWHISRQECLCIFSHNDTVPTIVFHPKDDRYFLSGSLDGKLRLWNIPDKKVCQWKEARVPSSARVATSLTGRDHPEPKTVITCAAFACEGTRIAVGTYDGRVIFFNSDLNEIVSITIKSHHGKVICRVTAIEIDPTDANKILVTSNDSRVRLIDARDYHTLCKYRGFENNTSQIKATFSPTGKYIISGSENQFFYIWKKVNELNRVSRFSTARKDRNNQWEAIKAHESVVTAAIFSPNPYIILNKKMRHLPLLMQGLGDESDMNTANKEYLGDVIVTADCNGIIKVFKNRM